MANFSARTTASAEKKLQVKPLTFPSPSPTASPSFLLDEEAATSSQYLRKRRGLFWCSGCCGASIIIIGLVILILSFTVFKIKDPVLTLNSLYLDGVNGGLRNTDEPSLSVNATLTADISIKNPNVASFKFDNSTTEFYYQGVTVGVGYAPNGQVKADRTLRMNVTVDVLADKAGNATGSILNGGTVNITTFTDINGRVDVIGIYKRDIEVMLNCSMMLVVTLQAQEISDKVCVASVR